MTLLFPDADDIADRAEQARQADMDATCQHGVTWPQDCDDCWLEAELAYERRCDA